MELTNEIYRKVMRKGWNMTLDEYDRSWVSVLGRYAERCVELGDLQPGDRVLDIATGPGTAAFLAAARVGSSGSVLGTDISDNFIEAATQRAAREEAANVRFERHAMEELGVAADSIDVALCVLGLMFAAPVDAALSEITRVLTPKTGRFVACVWGRRAKCGFREVFSILSGPLQMQICPLFFALGEPGALTSALQSVGMHDVREEHKEVTLHWKDDDDACAAMFDGGPVAYPYSLFSPEVKEQVAGEYLASLAPYRNGQGFEVPAEFVCVAATNA